MEIVIMPFACIGTVTLIVWLAAIVYLAIDGAWWSIRWAGRKLFPLRPPDVVTIPPDMMQP